MATFFLDRGLGAHIIPEGLRALGWEVITMDERYGAERSQEIADTDWIRDASGRGECILTKDAAIARRPAEAQVVYACAARVFTIKNAQITGPQMLALIVQHADAIARQADRAEGPYVMGIGHARIERLRLAFP